MGRLLKRLPPQPLLAVRTGGSTPLASTLTRTPKLEAPDRLEHWPLKASRSLGSIKQDAAAADRKALSDQASAPPKRLELRNSGNEKSAKPGDGVGAFWFVLDELDLYFDVGGREQDWW